MSNNIIHLSTAKTAKEREKMDAAKQMILNSLAALENMTNREILETEEQARRDVVESLTREELWTIVLRDLDNDAFWKGEMKEENLFTIVQEARERMINVTKKLLEKYPLEAVFSEEEVLDIRPRFIKVGVLT